MITKKRWPDKVMLGFYKKEATYGAGVVMDATNSCSLKGHDTTVEWTDTLIDDKDDVTGLEFGTDSELVEQGVKISVKEAKAKPNTLLGTAALVLGAPTTIKDGTAAAYRTRVLPVASGIALPSTQVEEVTGGVQYAYTGVKGNSLKIAANDRLVSVESELMGSGSRVISATAFSASITESWLKLKNCKVFMENGSAITIAATLTQGTEDISSGTPVDLSARLKGFEFGFNNNLEGQPGYGGAGVLQDIDCGRRTADLKFTLLFSSTTELNHYLNQDPLAVEFDLMGGVIDAAGTPWYYGFHLIVPRFKLKSAPRPTLDGDKYVCEMDCDIQDDGTNAAVIIEGYNAKAAYLA